MMLSWRPWLGCFPEHPDTTMPPPGDVICSLWPRVSVFSQAQVWVGGVVPPRVAAGCQPVWEAEGGLQPGVRRSALRLGCDEKAGVCFAEMPVLRVASLLGQRPQVPQLRNGDTFDCRTWGLALQDTKPLHPRCHSTRAGIGPQNSPIFRLSAADRVLDPQNANGQIHRQVL